MFENDENGKILRLIGDEAEELINEYVIANTNVC